MPLLIDAGEFSATPATETATDGNGDRNDIARTAGETLRERKAVAAKAARRRARERLASLEHQADVLRQWVSSLQSLVTSARSGPLSPADADDTPSCSSTPPMPPKKRHRSSTFMVEDVCGLNRD